MVAAPKPKFTAQQYDDLLAAQGGVCWLCHKRPGKRRLSQDHDHLTGRTRGLIHQRENRALGAFEYNDEVLTRLQSYVTIILRDHKKHKENTDV